MSYGCYQFGTTQFALNFKVAGTDATYLCVLKKSANKQQNLISTQKNLKSSYLQKFSFKQNKNDKVLLIRD